MKTVAIEEASRPLADYAANLGAGSIVVTSKRRPVAALVSLRDVERESLALSLDPAFMAIIRRARAEARRGEVHSLEQVKRELTRPRRRHASRKRRKQPRR